MNSWEDVRKISIIPGKSFDEFVCPYCSSVFFYNPSNHVVVHDCPFIKKGSCKVYVLNEYAFRYVDLYNEKEKNTTGDK